MSKEDKIGQHCWYETFDIKSRTKNHVGGQLLGWSTNFEELQNGVGQFPIGIIMDVGTQKVVVVPAVHIQFGAIPQ